MSLRPHVALKKSFAVLAIAKSFGAADSGGREAGTHIAEFKTVLKASSANEFVQETCIEAVACSDGIDRLNGKRSSMKAVFSAFGEYAFRTTFNDNHGDEI